MWTSKNTPKSDECFLLKRLRKNPFATCNQLQREFSSFSTETTISAKTTRRILRRRILIGHWGVQNLSSLALMFVDDTCPLHLAKSVNQWKRGNRVCRVPWSAYSPDLKLIETMWAYFERQLRLKAWRKLLSMYRIIFPSFFIEISLIYLM